MLNKEECEKAIKIIEEGTNEIEDFRSIPKGYYNEFEQEIGVIKQLIEEYFELLDKYYKLESENIGLKKTIANFKEKQEKFFRNI